MSALRKRSERAIKTARQEHRCGRCGRVIRKGDKFVMRMDWESGSLAHYPTCLDCDAKRYEKERDGRGV